MVKTIGPLLSLDAHGTVAGLLTFSKRRSCKQVRFQKKQTDVITTARTAHRNLFLFAITAWHTLTTEQKETYNVRARPLPITGYNLYIQEYIQASYAPKISNGDIDDDDMSDISAWQDADVGDGVSSQVAFDGKSCMKLDSGPSTGVQSARRYQDIGSFGARTILSWNIYCHALGTYQNNDGLLITAYNGTKRFSFILTSTGLYVYSSVPVITLIDADIIILDTWQEWTFDIKWDDLLCDVYLNGILRYSNVSTGWAVASTNGTMQFIQYGHATAHRLSYIDWFKAGSAFA